MSDKERYPQRGGKLPPKSKPEAGDETPERRAETRVVGTTFWDIVSGVLGALKQPNVALPVSLMVVGGITLLVMSDRLRIICDKGGNCKLESGLPAETFAAREGRRRELPYVLDAVSVLIRVEDNLAKKERYVKWRITYVVRALRPITATDRIFKETYIADGASVDEESWFCTDKMYRATDGCREVTFSIAEADTHIVITGATNVYKLPLEDNRPAFGQRIQLAPDEMFFSYDNDVDVIGALSMTVESSTLSVSPVSHAAKRSEVDKSVVTDEMQLNPTGCPETDSARCRQSFTAHWKNLVPHEEVGVHIKVKP